MASNAPSVIACRVRDREGNPVAGARVFFTGGPGSFPEIAALTDDAGSATLTAPMPGAYEVQVVADGYMPERAAITVAGVQETREFVLENS